MKAARHIVVSGMVQGVGYRFFCRHQAAALGLTGYVKNLADGDVEVVVEGEEEIVGHFIKILRKGPHFSEVRDLNITTLPYEAKYNVFQIEF